ncbi:MATE family efflux transporter [Bradyrhizobium sp. STM 3809]|uniref:MATE family efflux transporter n=1 Tax=Bradyrhizobium sp. STM 3809 TaxID=551936 RepID=UPI0002407D18|nr:MATE family efflux transporter [Bradyrhizobium sp. STM 3809]CCE02739.1 Cation efflux pump, DNA-damage-inducible protein [Bradyrhizobium sp. STM 3809]
MFAIAGPAMLANITTPLIGVVATTAIGRLGEASQLGGVAMASVIFDCTFWLFGFLRMSTLAFTAQSLGAGDTSGIRVTLMRGLLVAALVGGVLIALQRPLADSLFAAMGGSDAVISAGRSYFLIRIWSAPFALANYVSLGWLVGQAWARLALGVQITINLINMTATLLLVSLLGFGVNGAAIAAVIAEASGVAIGFAVARHYLPGRLVESWRQLLDREQLLQVLAVNRDIMIRTSALIAVYLFFSAQGARAGDVTLAANAVLNNFLLVSAFFLDGFANAAEQLCGFAVGARDRKAFKGATQLILAWGFGFALAVAIGLAVAGPALIDLMTASAAVRLAARDFLVFVIVSPLPAVFAFAFDGIYIGATWARDMRNLMIASLAAFFLTWLALRSLGNTALWFGLLAFYASRGALQAARYPALLRTSFGTGPARPTR